MSLEPLLDPVPIYRSGQRLLPQFRGLSHITRNTPQKHRWHYVFLIEKNTAPYFSWYYLNIWRSMFFMHFNNFIKISLFQQKFHGNGSPMFEQCYVCLSYCSLALTIRMADLLQTIFLPKVLINNKPALIQIIAWHQTSGKPLSWSIIYMHHSASMI